MVNSIIWLNGTEYWGDIKMKINMKIEIDDVEIKAIIRRTLEEINFDIFTTSKR